MRNINKELGLDMSGFNQPERNIEERTGMLESFNWLGAGEGRQKDKKEFGKMGAPNDATLQASRNYVYDKYNKEKAQKMSASDVNTMLSQMEDEIAVNVKKTGKPKSAIGKGISFGQDFKFNGTCGNDIGCINRAVADIRFLQEQKIDIAAIWSSLKDKEKKANPEGNTTTTFGGTGGSGSTSTPASRTAKFVIWGSIALVTTAIIIVIVKKKMKK